MIGVFVTFRYGGDFDEQALRGIAGNARATFERMPGLRSKAFTIDSGKREAINFYVWDSDDAAAVAQNPGVHPLVEEVVGISGDHAELPLISSRQGRLGMISSLLQYAGVAVFAVSGALAAGRKSLDLIGVVVIATATAIGGGTLRDLLIERHPVFWIDQPVYLWVIVAAALLTIAYTRWFSPPERGLAYADAVGLALFSISGAQIAEQRGLPPETVVLMGTITGVAGGVLRDVLTAQIPLIFRRGRFYATAAIAGVVLYLLLQVAIERTLAALAGMLLIAALRIAAIHWNLKLPVYSLPRRDDES